MLRAAIAGGSGYTGGELLRLLLFHPRVEVAAVTAERHAGRAVAQVHPNLRRVTELRFVPLEHLEPCDVLFLCLPHGRSQELLTRLESLAPRIIDLGADFRLRDPAAYARWYGTEHRCPDRLGDFVYGVPELNREPLREARFVACAGCNATAVLLALYPFHRAGLLAPERPVVADVKVGSSEGGSRTTEASHHPERSGCVRSYRPAGHRHEAELRQELGRLGPLEVLLSVTAVERVRGVLATCHLFPRASLEERDIWALLRESYDNEPFVRLVKQSRGIHRYPDPKLLPGTNWCDLGFAQDPSGPRVVVLCAMDNLMKGAAGQAVQCMNVMYGFPETEGLTFPGLHPV